MKRLLICINLILIVIVSCSCSIFDKKYISVEEYKIPTNSSPTNRQLSVSNVDDIKEAIISIVYSGHNDGTIEFIENYEGNPDEDLKNACWQVQSRDALCVYCVNNISYKLSKVVSYYKADITIKYEDTVIPLSDIHILQYSSGLEDIISTSLYNMDKKLGILVNKSLYSVNDVENLILNTYFNNPLISPMFPNIFINPYSGSNNQRFYEILFDYRISDDELVNRKKQLDDVSIIFRDIEKLDDKGKVDSIITRLSKVTFADNASSVYDALINNYADSLGVALGFKALCNSLDVESYVVKGIKLGNEYYWNIVKIDNEYYHVVIDTPSLWYVNDEMMWSTYRWNISDYPSCHNTLDNKDLIDNLNHEAEYDTTINNSDVS